MWHSTTKLRKKIKNPKSYFDDKLSPWEQFKKSISLLKKRKKLRNYVSMSALDSGILLTLYRFETLYFAQLIPLYLINVVRIITHTAGYFSFLIVPIFKKINFLQLLLNFIVKKVKLWYIIYDWGGLTYGKRIIRK